MRGRRAGFYQFEDYMSCNQPPGDAVRVQAGRWRCGQGAAPRTRHTGTEIDRRLTTAVVTSIRSLYTSYDAERGHTAPATRRRCDPVLHFMLFLIHA